MYLSDIHTHSIASGHGTTCTISDMAKAASQKGLKLLGITDHGPATLAAGTFSYFRSLIYSPRKRFDVELLYGIELNILATDGKTDLPQELLDKLDYAIASMHYQNFRPKTREENTAAFLNVMKNPVVKILGHIDNPQYDIDYDAVVKAAGETVFSLRSTKLPGALRISGRYNANCAQILSCCRKYLVPIVLSVTVMEQSILRLHLCR